MIDGDMIDGRCAFAKKVHFQQLLSVNLTFELMTLKVGLSPCGD